MVYMNTYKLFANGFDQQRGYDRRIHAPGKSEKNLFVSHLLPDLFYLFRNKSFCQFRCSDAFHVFRTFVVIHRFFSFSLKL